MKKILILLIIMLFCVNVYSQKNKIHFFKLSDKKFKVGAIYYIDLSKLKYHNNLCGEFNNDEDEFDSIVNFLLRNRNIKIEIGYHTDSRRIPMTNDTLSKRKADLIKEYMIVRGINQNRIEAVGYANRIPLYIDKETKVEYKGKNGMAPTIIVSFPKGVTLTDEYIKTLITIEEKECAHQQNRRLVIKILGI